MRIYAIFPWTGGKHGLVPYLLKLIPEHHTYVEVFGGAAALLFYKKPSGLEFYNDINSDLVNFFQVLRDPQLFPRLYRMLLLTPYSREEFQNAKRYLQTPIDQSDCLYRAYYFFIVAKMSFGGNISGGGWQYSVTTKKKTHHPLNWVNAIHRLPQFFHRIQNVYIENLDFREIIKRHDRPDTLFYLDPPYPHQTRSKKQLYQYEMSDQDHHELISLVTKAKGKILVSTISNPIYDQLKNYGWKLYEIKRISSVAATPKGNPKPIRLEQIWVSPNISSNNLDLPNLSLQEGYQQLNLSLPEGEINSNGT